MRLTFDKVVENLTKEGNILLYQYRDFVNSYKVDVFRSQIPDADKYAKELRDDLIIIESKVIYNQRVKDQEGLGYKLFIWMLDYDEYENKKEIFELSKSKFVDYDDYKDFHMAFKNEKEMLVRNAPFGEVKPTLENIVDIFKDIELDMEFNEDIYYEIKTFLKRYEMYKELILNKKI